MEECFSKIAVIIPCFRVRQHILDLLSKIPGCVTGIFVVDDCCPDKTGDYVALMCADPRVSIVWNDKNLGVGGAVMAGYRAAINADYGVLVKVDGDGQMDPSLIPIFTAPIEEGSADYVKGNRFYDVEKCRSMPVIRLAGNAGLSLVTKLSSGYWDIMDPTNGYTAISARAAKTLPFDKISQRYFFESDILFRLNLQRAVVVDVPMSAKYGEEISNLKIRKIFFEFIYKNIRNTTKRILYNYFIRDFSIATVQLVAGSLLFGFGLIFGLSQWLSVSRTGIQASAGTVMVASLPILLGIQFLLGFLTYDVQSVPRRPISKSLSVRS